jgi:hypothetical protein
MTKKAKATSKTKITTWAQAMPKEGVVCIYGHRRKGKTATAWWLAERMGKKRPVAALMFPKRARGLLPKAITHVTSIPQLKKLTGYLVVADEMAIHANAREHQSDTNKELYKLMAVSAQCHQLLLLICQHTRQLDVGLAMEPDIVVFKQPSLLHIRFARPELKPEVEEAWKAFAMARGDKRAWSYVVNFHDGSKGFLHNRLPSFWSQELSEAYALYELNLEISPKRGNKAVRHKKPAQKTRGLTR